jgi:NADH-quinone oxidoreductase subunit C
VYHLYSVKHNRRVRVKVQPDGPEPEVPSITPLYKIADWLEREVWDMFGIEFAGHPDLRRILMYDEFVGHPLRRDYPYDKRQPIVEARTKHL